MRWWRVVGAEEEEPLLRDTEIHFSQHFILFDMTALSLCFKETIDFGFYQCSAYVWKRGEGK